MNCFRLVFLGLLFSFTSLYGADRVALVIGIDRYEHFPQESQLSVAVSDARLIAGTLEKLNPPFKVTILTDVAQRDAMESLAEFVDQAEEAECALVYFAGHGVEYHGSNYLLASDTKITNISPDVERMKRRLSLSALPLQAVVDELDGTKAQVKVVILDACRDNPLKLVGRTGTRSTFGKTRGLAQVSPPTGTLIAFSADAGQQANDGLFTRILTKNLTKPGIPLPHVFALTREEVRAESISLEESNRGVFHEPAEYTKLNVAGMKFSFSLGKSEGPPESLANQRPRFSSPRGMEGIQAGENRRICGIEMVWCPLGEFLMGSPDTEEYRNWTRFPPKDDNESQHRAKLTRGFWMARTECTQEQWQFIMEDNPSRFEGTELPVEMVSWEDCQKWIKKMNEKHPLTSPWKWMLPTETQWEYACRAETSTAFAFGNSLGSSQANFAGEYPYGGAPDGRSLKKTAKVGSYRPNDWGLFDMHGNVSEWCWDWYGEEYYRNGQSDPTGPSIGSNRVIRGGGWSDSARFCRSAFRNSNTPYVRYEFLGFRVIIGRSR